MMRPQTKNKISLLLILAVFLGPFVAAYLWIKYNDGPRSGHVFSLGQSNYGKLVLPVRPLDLSGLKDLQGRPLTSRDLAGYWTYVYIDSSQCDKRCQRNIYYQRQVRLLQGREMGRVKALFVVRDTQGLNELKGHLQNFPVLKVAVLAPEAARKFTAQLEVKDPATGKPSFAERRIYLMDPRGQVMMYYDTNRDLSLDRKLAKGMVKDLKRLLKINKDVVEKK